MMLSRARRETLEAIADAIELRGRPPSLREIAARRGVSNPSVVFYTLARLERDGLITRVHRDARSTQLTPAGYAAIERVPPTADAALGRALRQAARESRVMALVLRRFEVVA